MVTKDIARYSRLKLEMELWDQLRNDATEALDLLEEFHNSNEEDDEEMVALTQEECQSSAEQLLQLSQKY